MADSYPIPAPLSKKKNFATKQGRHRNITREVITTPPDGFWFLGAEGKLPRMDFLPAQNTSPPPKYGMISARLLWNRDTPGFNRVILGG